MPTQPRSLTRAVLTLLAGGAAAQLVPLLLGPLLARLYSPAAMGVYTVFAAWAASIAVLACARFDFALPMAKSEGEAEGLLALCLRIGVVVVWGMTCLSPVIGWLWPRTDQLLLWLAPMVALMAGLQLLLMWATRAERFRAMAASRFVQYGGTAILQVALGAWALGAWNPGVLNSDAFNLGALSSGVLSADALNSDDLHVGGGFMANASGIPADGAWLLVAAQALALVLAVLCVCQPAPRAGWRRAWQPPVDAPPLGALARQYRDFPLLNAPHAFLGALQDALAVALIVAFTGEAAAGFWGLALRYLKAPAALVGQAVSQAVYPRLAQADVAQGRAIVRRLLLLLGALGVLGAALLMVLGPALFAWAFGEAWRPAGELARALAPYIAVHFVAAPLAVVTMAWQAQAWAFKLALVGQAVFVLALGLGLWLGGLQGAAWAVSLAMLPYFGLYFWRLANWPARQSPATPD